MLFFIIGEINAHSYILVNYLLPSLSPFVLSMGGGGECSENFLMNSFLNYIADVVLS